MEFQVTRASCTGEPFDPFTDTVQTDLEDVLLPGGIPPFEDAPLDSESAHLLADRFFVVPPDCYDVATQPITCDGSPSQDCAPAHKNGVVVVDGETTEIMLLSQCQGTGSGGLDIIAGLNHPPEIVGLTYEPSKFLAQCQEDRVCVTATDSDGDPLELVWIQESGKEPFAGPHSIVETTNADGSITQCAVVNFDEAGSYELDVTVYDLFHGGGGLIRVEDWLAAEGYPNDSHASLSFPIHVVDQQADILPAQNQWNVVQGGTILGTVTAVAAAASVADFYAYSQVDGSSYNAHHFYPSAPVPESSLSMLFVHRDDNTGEASVVMVHDRAGDGDGGQVDLTVSGLGRSAYASELDIPEPEPEPVPIPLTGAVALSRQ